MLLRIPKNLRHLICAFGSSVIVYRYHSYVGTVVYCEGISMEPTVNNGDYLLVERISVTCGKIKRRSNNYSHVLKRIKALGDESVTYWDDMHCATVAREVPLNHVWLEGDNSSHSLDSRNYGPVPISRLEYRVLLRLWPLTGFGRLSSHGPCSTTPLPVPSPPNLTTPVEACSEFALLDKKSQM
ncbi:Mitochondrial inner membrane protease subunit 1 [Fasciolopsis buskii]|uniref:Mitochondrial inner membrane protease subunit 1 n=1 Tax=Fasciolopsis buskii TaxID=27845 RepID=A0A8E0VM63_9TREM|nr:Mitochondrial inner membrane protease subunit 1 [Fasciolopsis buski]